jgi:hypothetical protein
MTNFRIQEWESLGFEWNCSDAAWEARRSELTYFCKIHGHCNVPQSYSENTKLANWVATQRTNYWLHKEGKKSYMTLSHIQELESLGFEWDVHAATWGDHLSELADYRKIHGHCNVPRNYIENTKLATWVNTQRSNYRLHEKGHTSYMTLSRVQELKSLGFEWELSISRGRGTRKEPSLDEGVACIRKTLANHFQLETAPSYEILRATGYY